MPEIPIRTRLMAAAVAVALWALVGSGAGSSAAAGGPPTVQWASLSQSGQDLVWRAQLSAPFTAGGLAGQNATLCLLIQTVTTGALREQVCLTPAGRHSALVALYGSQRKTIAATVTRPTASTLRAEFLPGAIGLLYRELGWQTQTTAPGGACGSPSPCTSTYPSQGQVLKLHTPRLVGCKASGPTWVFHGPTRVHDIALAFDDGPWGQPPTMDFVNELARLHVPGTFFEIGDQISTYDPRGAVERAMLAHGDMIGNHTWTHPDMLTVSPGAQRSQLTMTDAAIKRATGFQPCLFRSPYGDVNPELLGLVRSLGMTTIQWDIDPRDWTLPGVGAIESTILAQATNGGITEEHFGGGPRYETLDSLADVVGTLRKRRYKFVTVTQMLGYRLIYK